MFNTPTDWLYTELGALSSIKTGKKDVNEGDPDGNYPFFTCSRTPSRSRSFSFDTEAILIAGNGEVGNVIYFKGKFEAYQRTYVLHDFKANTQYLTHFLRANLRARLESQHIGSVIPFIKLGDLNDFSIRLPANTVEQQKIVQILDTLDTQIQKTEALIAKLEKIKEGLLHDLLTRGIDQNGKLRPTPEQAPELYKESALGLIPKEWHKGTISDYLLQNGGIKPGPFGSSITKNMYRSSGYKIYGQEQVIRADPTFGNYYIDRNKYSELIDFSVQPRDILISLVGTVGKVLIIPESHEQGIINPRLMRLRPNQNICNSEFLSHVLTSVLFTRKLTALAGGGTMPVINKRIVQSVVLPVIPLTEQNEIRSKISSLLGRLVNEKAMLAKLQAQKIGLMDDLLTGHVRVTTLLKDAV
jgi:type I restriction enzyme S subunit